MGLEILTLGSSKTYTRESLLGGGAVVGKNVTISSITPIEGGNKVTFSYTLDDGTVKTSSMNVMDGKDGIDGTNGKNGKDGQPGKDGSDGVGISKIEKIGTVDLVDTYRITFTDNSTFDYEVKNGADGQGGTGGSGTAEDTTYTNENFPQYDNVDLALDALFNKVYYVKPKINSFTMTPSTTEYEIGTVINEVTFDWTVNKDIVNQTLTDCTITVDDRTATYSSDISSTKTFTLTIYDEENSASSSKKISFLPKIYYGSATEPAEYDSAFALGLSNSVLSSSVKRDYSFNCGSGEYSYIICPTSCSFDGNIWVNGFQADMQGQGSISLTNASGYTQSYDVWRFANHSLGSFVGTVK